jgi:hypothetical protein
VQNGSGSNLQDKSKPHSKLTAIEHLLKAELEASIGTKLDQNKDLMVVDMDEGLGANRVTRQTPTKDKEDEGYWSDFSDDVYTQEVNEEKKSAEVLFSLQRWIYNSNLESELNSKFMGRDIITLDEFKDALNEAGYYCEFLDLQALLKRLDIVDNKGINYKQFLSNVMERNAAWWKERLSNNGFDITSKGRRDGNYVPLCNKAIYNFITRNLGDKVKQAINRAGYLNVHEFIEDMFADCEAGLTKRELRRQLLEKDIPLTRLDTHILFKMLEHSGEGIVYEDDFKRLVDDSREFIIDEDNGATMSGNVWIDEEVEFGDGIMKNVSHSSPYDQALINLNDYIRKNSVDALQKLTQFDTKKDGIANRQIFLNFNKDIKSPLTTLEQKGLITHLISEAGGKLTIPDLSKFCVSKIYN